MRYVVCLVAILSLVLVACDEAPAVATGDAKVADAGDVEVPLDQVPAAVKAAAEQAVPGIVLSEAEREIEDGQTIYDLEGAVNGKSYELEITAAGKVIEVEEEDGDDDDEDDDDDD